MANKKIDLSSYKSYGEVAARLDEIVGTVRSKDTSLELSLDLLDEAIALGSKAVDLVERIDLADQPDNASAEGKQANDSDRPGSGQGA